MKLANNYLVKSYHDAAIAQKSHELKEKGYSVEIEKKIEIANRTFIVDLYAEKGAEKKLYEFKVRNTDYFDLAKIRQLKDLSKFVNASLDIVYITPPEKTQIECDGLEEQIDSYFSREEYPPIINELSTHTSVHYIEISELKYCYIDADIIKLNGEGLFHLELQWGSDSDVRNDDGLIGSTSLPFKFSLSMNHDMEVQNLDYDVDTSDFYDKDTY